MQFSDITTAVHDAWIFAWPPLVLCTIAYLVAHFFNPKGTDEFLHRIIALISEYGKKLNAFTTLIEPYGLNKLVPVIPLALIVVFMYLLNGPVTVAVSDLPPHLSYRPGLLIGNHLSENQRLLLIRNYPSATDFANAYVLAQDNVFQLSALGNRAEIWYKIQNFLKFSLLFSIIMVFINIKKGLGAFRQIIKFIFFFVVIIALWSVSLVGLLYQQEQQFYQEWRIIELSLQEDAGTTLSAPITKEEKQKIHIGDDRQRWWDLYFIDFYRIDWILRTFFPQIEEELRQNPLYNELLN